MSPYPSIKFQLDAMSVDQRNTLKKIPNLGDIDGWLLLSEAVELYDLCQKIGPEKPVVCEIGSWKGKSAYVLASAVKDRKGILYSVDPFDGDGDEASVETYKDEMNKLDISLLKNFENTLERFNLRKFVKILPFKSQEARKKFDGEKIDLLFIDGNHEYDSVKNDYNLWSPVISSGGYLILHDVKAVHVDGPRRVYEEFLLGNPNWKNVRIVGEMGIAEKI